jgi:hypothetical protein
MHAPASSGHQVQVDDLTIELRNRSWAVLLAWLFPGAGHFYQRRYNKAAMFSLCVLVIFLLGMFVGRGHVVYFSWKPEDRRWHYLCQVHVGVLALPAAVQAWHLRSAAEPLWWGWMAPPQDMRQLSQWHDSTSNGFDLGCLYTMVAGLLNLLIVFDAFSGPLPVASPASRRPAQR